MDLGKLMKQAKQMQANMSKIEKELNETEYTGSHNDLVSVVVTGEHKVVSVKINEDLLEKDNKEVLEDMIALALNDAMVKVSADRQKKLGSLTGGMNIPGLG